MSRWCGVFIFWAAGYQVMQKNQISFVWQRCHFQDVDIDEQENFEPIEENIEAPPVYPQSSSTISPEVNIVFIPKSFTNHAQETPPPKYDEWFKGGIFRCAQMKNWVLKVISSRC